MERTPGLEGADALIVLAFEEEVYFRLRWGRAFEGGADKCIWGLRG
jgi:hypothetical protein